MTNELANYLTDEELESGLAKLNEMPFRRDEVMGVVVYSKETEQFWVSSQYDDDNFVLLYLKLLSDKTFPPHKDAMVHIGENLLFKRMARLSDQKVFLARIYPANNSIEDVAFSTAYAPEGEWGLVPSHVDP